MRRAPIQIVPEDGIPVPAKLVERSKADGIRSRLQRLTIGQSFFVEGMTVKECGYIKTVAKRMGVFLTGEYTDYDERRKAAGTRLWRVDGPPVKTPSTPRKISRSGL